MEHLPGNALKTPSRVLPRSYRPHHRPTSPSSTPEPYQLYKPTLALLALPDLPALVAHLSPTSPTSPTGEHQRILLRFYKDCMTISNIYRDHPEWNTCRETFSKLLVACYHGAIGPTIALPAPVEHRSPTSSSSPP